MYSPIPAKQARPPHGRSPRVRQPDEPHESRSGYFVPYRRVRPIAGTVAQWAAVVEMFVQDLSTGSTSTAFIPFIIDTGSDRTILPRKLLPPRAFPISCAERLYAEPVVHCTGGVVFGHAFSASLHILLRDTESIPLKFGILTVVVVDTWEGEYAVLGLDALRQVGMLSDDSGLSLWPPQALLVRPVLSLPEGVQRRANLYTWARLGDALTPALEGELSHKGGVPTWRIKVFHKRTRRPRGELHISHNGEGVEWCVKNNKRDA